MSDRCTGHCCREFSLPLTQAEIDAYSAGDVPGDETTDRGFMARHAVFLFWRNGQAYFTCKQLNEATGNCMAYDRRPRVCSDYPSYGRLEHGCSNKGCTWESGRAHGGHLLRGRMDWTTAEAEERHRITENRRLYKLRIGATYRTVAKCCECGKPVEKPRSTPAYCPDCLDEVRGWLALDAQIRQAMKATKNKENQS